MIRSLESLEKEAREWGHIYERDALQLIARVRELEAVADPGVAADTTTDTEGRVWIGRHLVGNSADCPACQADRDALAAVRDAQPHRFGGIL